LPSLEPASAGVVLSSLADVERLHAAPARLWSLPGPFVLRLPQVPFSERERLEARLNELAGVCGCAEGSVAGGVALIAVVVVWGLRHLSFTFPSVFRATALVIGASLLAKLVRVMTARAQLRRLLGALLRLRVE